MLDYFDSNDFKIKLLDSFNQPWKFNWFCLDHVGFRGENPRRRDAGDHKVFDFYSKRYSHNALHEISWHYHPLPINGNFHGSGVTYLNSGNIFNIICKKIIEREWFPSSYRPGFHTERPDSHWFLEQWIPFDYGNQSLLKEDNLQPDLSHGRYGDWQGAPTDWTYYHPSHDCYKKRGNCKRYIMRCLNMESRIRCIDQKEVDNAFSRARTQDDTILAFTNHDFRDMKSEVEKIYNMLLKS
jgi:hypothetical protein